MKRREFLETAGLAAGAAPARPGIESARRDFPWAERELYLNSATEHPLPLVSARAMERYIRAITRGPDAERDRHENNELQARVRALFATLIHAQPSEIGFVPATQIAENLVLDGLEIQQRGANVVTNDLHYAGSLFMYRQRQAAGLDVRVVKSQDGRIRLSDVERVVDRKTRLIAVALVSNVNGYLEDVRALGALAHAHVGYLFADVIQAAGAVPIDVRAMNVDFLACSAYKWLMGGRFGYLYVPAELQGSVLKPKQFGGRSSQPGAGRYQVSTASHLGCVCQHESLQYILRLGVENIQAHNLVLNQRLRKELPRLGYKCLTPFEAPTPISTFRFRNGDEVKKKLQRAAAVVTLRLGERENQMRVSPSVFNHLGDIDRFIEALEG
jgi:selenocysteine lyase/cysteine desulfurase